jgi:hypothetical protein
MGGGEEFGVQRVYTKLEFTLATRPYRICKTSSLPPTHKLDRLCWSIALPLGLSYHPLCIVGTLPDLFISNAESASLLLVLWWRRKTEVRGVRYIRYCVLRGVRYCVPRGVYAVWYAGLDNKDCLLAQDNQIWLSGKQILLQTCPTDNHMCFVFLLTFNTLDK